MQLRHSYERFSSFNPSLPSGSPEFHYPTTQTRASSISHKSLSAKTPNFIFSNSFKILSFRAKIPILRRTHAVFCSKSEVFEGLESVQENPESEDFGELELRGKPSPKQVNTMPEAEKEDEEMYKSNKDEVLEDFYKFFKPVDSLKQESDSEEAQKETAIGEEGSEKVSVEYYEPKPGDMVVGVVVSGNENKLDVNVGADLLGTMLTKEVLPLYDKEMNYLLCDVEKESGEFLVNGRVGIVKNDEALSWEAIPGRPIVETGTILFAEVLGRTLSGRPLLSTRRLFRRIAWHRLRQIMQLNEPIIVKITEWNTGGLLTRIEGLRAFLPKIELINRINSYTALKENVGRWFHVLITRDEDTNDLILSEKEAWELLYLRIADLETEPGLFLLNKERVFSEAEEMAKKYRQKIPAAVSRAQKLESLPASVIPFEDEQSCLANWNWFWFERNAEKSSLIPFF